MKLFKGGFTINYIISMLLSILTILSISKHVASVQPEYDKDVVNRLRNIVKIKDLFYNRHGTCALNVALFLGSIDLETYETASASIIRRGHGLSFTEMSSYLNSSLLTLWEWDKISTPNIPEKYHLRGALDTDREIIVKNYISDLKRKMREIRNEKLARNIDGRVVDPNIGILTALSYPSSNVHHAVVVWLSMDDTFAVIDPQEFIGGNDVVLYSDNPAKYSQFTSLNIYDYFMENLDLDRDEEIVSILLKDFHVKREENLENLVDSQERIQKVIQNLRTVEIAEF